MATEASGEPSSFLFTMPFTARMRPDVMGRAENWVLGRELLFSQIVICHKTLGNFFLGLSRGGGQAGEEALIDDFKSDPKAHVINSLTKYPSLSTVLSSWTSISFSVIYLNGPYLTPQEKTICLALKTYTVK